MTVFFATPVMRTVERTELPSIRQLMTLARCSEVSLFILLVCQTAHALSRLLAIFLGSIFRHENIMKKLNLAPSTRRTGDAEVEILQTGPPVHRTARSIMPIAEAKEPPPRSEERRVGKECRARSMP